MEKRYVATLVREVQVTRRGRVGVERLYGVLDMRSGRSVTRELPLEQAVAQVERLEAWLRT